ncbi:MAG: class I SAM-dependent rRNA methyltransferase [Betaproteobacteria bacterium]|nr:class I SAM-dependent rRNA methyltransferase [Betaproteobacteria bacterium]
MNNKLILKSGRERSLERRHPWVFSGAVDVLRGTPGVGDNVQVCASDGRFLAWAAYSPHSQIRARVWTFDPDEPPGPALFRARLALALAKRASLRATGDSDAWRLVNGEGDRLPGLIVDFYAGTLVVQILSAGAERWRDTWLELLGELGGCDSIYERSDADVRELEGLPARTGVVHGSMPVGAVQIKEHGLRYSVDIAGGQKTGFYLDQRDNRQRVGSLARDRDVLNCFCYSGGFSLSALFSGARHVTSVDSSAPALQLAKANAALNDMAGRNAEWVEADVFRYLRQLRDESRRFDLIVLDPPKFAPTSKDAERASRGYKDINLSALKLLRPGGILATFSCSSGVPAELFQKIVAGAAADAGATATVIGRFSAAEDHPVRLEFPEGEYLKGLLLKID